MNHWMDFNKPLENNQWMYICNFRITLNQIGVGLLTLAKDSIWQLLLSNLSRPLHGHNIVSFTDIELSFAVVVAESHPLGIFFNGNH